MTLLDRLYTRPCSGMASLMVHFLLGGCSTATPHTYNPRQAIEYRHSNPGPFAVRPLPIPAVFGQPGGMVYLPDDHDDPAPLVIWQNGTGEPIATYHSIARHLASWGMAVLGSNDRRMGSGHRAIALVESAALWSSTPDHPLHGKIRAETFAFVGSSQGAVGAINAHTRFATGRAATALAIQGTPTTEAIDFFRLNLSYDPREVTAPILVLTGTEEALISPIALNRDIFAGLKGSELRALAIA